MIAPCGLYGILLSRKDTYINLNNAIDLFDSKRSFTIYKWNKKDLSYKQWIHFTGGRFHTIREDVANLKRHKKREIMTPMNKFFKDLDELQEWLGDYFVVFVDDLMQEQ